VFNSLNAPVVWTPIVTNQFDGSGSRVELAWRKGWAKSYAIQVSSDGQTWTDVYKTDAGKGFVETISFTPVTARWVRLWGTQRADKNSGYQIRELRVFAR
jgi:F5/8 type C domain